MIKKIIFNILLYLGKKKQSAGFHVEKSRKGNANFMVAFKKLQKVEKGYDTATKKFTGMDAFYVPKTESSKRLIFYIHGGGFVWGMEHLGAMYENFASRLAFETGSRVHTLDYRLIPEHNMPCALDDSDAFYQSFLDTGTDPEDIIFVGDSAGGCLVLALAQRLAKQNRALPKAIVSISAVTDASLTSGSRVSMADKDPLFHALTLQGIFNEIEKSIDLKNPEISPLNGDFKGLPPILFTVGGREMLLDDTMLAFRKAEAGGVEVQLEFSKNMIHDYPLFSDIYPEGKEGLDKIVSFIKEKH